MPYFVDFCRKRRLRAFYKVHKKHLQPRCSKLQRGRGGGFNGFLIKVKKCRIGIALHPSLLNQLIIIIKEDKSSLMRQFIREILHDFELFE